MFGITLLHSPWFKVVYLFGYCHRFMYTIWTGYVLPICFMMFPVSFLYLNFLHLFHPVCIRNGNGSREKIFPPMSLSLPLMTIFHFLLLYIPYFQLRTSSGADYWKPVDVHAVGDWDGTTLNVVAEAYWGNITLDFDATGSYRIIQDEHQLKGSGELKIPSIISCKHLKSSFEGTFIVSHSPGRLKVSLSTLRFLSSVDWMDVFSLVYGCPFVTFCLY